jgi:hypothetical protein
MLSLEWKDGKVSRLPNFVSATAILTCFLQQVLLRRALALARQQVTAPPPPSSPLPPLRLDLRDLVLSPFATAGSTPWAWSAVVPTGTTPLGALGPHLAHHLQLYSNFYLQRSNLDDSRGRGQAEAQGGAGASPIRAAWRSVPTTVVDRSTSRINNMRCDQNVCCHLTDKTGDKHFD